MNTQTRVKTAGRTDLDAYFSQHVGAWKELKLSPLLAFRQTDSGIAIDIVTKPLELLGLPDDTPIMGIWPGQWRSDYFQFTAGDYRKFWEAKP